MVRCLSHPLFEHSSRLEGEKGGKKETLKRETTREKVSNTDLSQIYVLCAYLFSSSLKILTHLQARCTPYLRLFLCKQIERTRL